MDSSTKTGKTNHSETAKKPFLNPERRKFLNDAALCVGGISLLGLLGEGVFRKANAGTGIWLRPPGALDEDTFVDACVRCGLCVRDCPYDTLVLADLQQNTASGTPVFSARNIPCEMCDDIPCVVACPTGALDPKLTDINEARMGLAVLIDQENCIAFQGLRCEVCFNACPIRGEAITIEKEHNVATGKHARFLPVVHSDYCTGCGKCEHVCILPEASAIKVLPINVAKADASEHYRYGLDEKEKHGSQQAVYDHQYTLPDDLEYDYDREGLRPKLPELELQPKSSTEKP